MTNTERINLHNIKLHECIKAAEKLPNVGDLCSGVHVIEVDELPTENIDRNAVYKLPKVGIDVFFKQDDETEIVSVIDELSAIYDITLYTVTTKPIKDVQISTGAVVHVYYIRDERSLMLCGGLDSDGNLIWIDAQLAILGLSFPVVEIADISEITSVGMYVLVTAGTYHKYDGSKWINYVVPIGTKTITENGMYDISDKAQVIVDVSKPRAYMVQTLASLPADAPSGSMAYILGGI